MVELSRPLSVAVCLLLSPCDNYSQPSYYFASAFSMTTGSVANRLVLGEDVRTSARHKTAFSTRLFLSSSDALESRTTEENVNVQNVAEAEKLRERARKLRLEAATAEQNLRRIMQQKKEYEKKEADEWIDLLLGATAASFSSEILSESGVMGEKNTPVRVGERKRVGTPNNNIPTAQTLSLRIEENQLSFRKLLKIVERLHERETAMLTGPEGLLSKQEASIQGGSGVGGFVLGDYENNSIEYKREETDRISGLLDRILEAVQILDDGGFSVKESENRKSSNRASMLRVRVSDLRQSRDALFQRRVDSIVGSTGAKKDSIDAYINSSIDGDDGNQKEDKERRKEDKMLERLFETPSWLPSSLAAFAATSAVEVSVSHWKMIKTDLLADSGFICTSWDSTDVAAVFRGRQPRTYTKSKSSPETENKDEEKTEISIATVFENLQARLEDHTELNDRVRLFLVNDNEWRPSLANDMGSFGNRVGNWDSEQNTPPPVIIALAKEVEPEQESERGLGTKSLAAFSTICSIFTTFAYALHSFALNPTFFNNVVKENDITAVPLCLPIFFGVLAVSALHEAGHFVAAKRHGVKLGSPVPIPSLQVGTFGSITPLRSFPPTRTALFDVAISGPGVSILVSLILLVLGLSLTISSQSVATFPVVPAATIKSSFLVGWIVSVIAPKMMMVPLSQPIPIHPLFFIGLAGLLMSAVNLLPIGRLDGGRAYMAARGRRAASLTSLLSLLVLAFYSFSGLSGVIIFWGAIVVMTQRLPDISAVDEVSGVGDLRVNGYLILLAVALLALVPFPGGVGPI